MAAAAAAASSGAATASSLMSQPGNPSLFFAEGLFSQLGLDSRLWKALASSHLSRLTLVQSAAIPHMLSGSNVLVQARTGSGKTLAYAIPLVQQILLEQTAEAGAASASSASTRLSRVVLLPSVELCEQVRRSIQSLLKYCDDSVHVVALKPDGVDAAQIRDHPDILVATPAQLLRYCQASAAEAAAGKGKKGKTSGFLSELPQRLRHLVLDEADLLLGQGYSQDLEVLLGTATFLGRGFQVSLFSATLDQGVQELKQLYMPSPVTTIKIKDAQTAAGRGGAKLTQLFYETKDRQDKFFMTVALLQTKLILAEHKVLIFVNNIPDAYKLRLFLEQYSIDSAVMNHELPRNSRQSILEHFNRGAIDILIATDEATEGEEEEEDEEDEEAENQPKGRGTKRLHGGQAKEEPMEVRHFGPTVEVTVDEGDSAAPAAAASSSRKKAKKDVKPVAKGKGKKPAAIQEGEDESMEAAEEDEVEDLAMKQEEGEEEEEEAAEEAEEADPNAEPENTEDIDAALASYETRAKANKRAQRKAKRRGASAFGASNMSRGVDFKDVSTVLNFDFPVSVKNYTHRCGRTARANRSGVALSFVEPAEAPLLLAMLAHQAEKRNGMGVEHAPGDLQALPFAAADLDGFRYRANDVIRRCTKAAVREARLKEIKLELLNSDRLRSHFEDNPRELALLKHDQVLRSKGIQKHLAVVPSYLLPEYMQGQASLVPVSQQQESHNGGANRNRLRRGKHEAKVAGKNQFAKSGIDKLKGFALKKAKGRHTMAMKNAGDPLRSFRSKPLNAAAAAGAGKATKTTVDF